MINKKEHLTSEGLLKIVSIRSAINLGCSPPLRGGGKNPPPPGGDGLSDKLKAAFPNVESVKIPLIYSSRDSLPINPQWLAGFVSGEGCFFVGIIKLSTHHHGFQVRLKFKLTQHIRDEELLISLVTYSVVIILFELLKLQGIFPVQS